MTHYNNSKIYIIKNKVNDLFYIGSTTNDLNRRMAQHRHLAKTDAKTAPLYQSMRELGVCNFFIELLEEYPCESKQQLFEREGHFIKMMESNNKEKGFNFSVAGRKKKQYIIDNIDRVKAWRDAYTKLRKEAKKEYDKEYRKQNIEEKKAYYKEYWEENKDIILNKQKQRYQQKKHEILKRMGEIVKCECGSECRRNDLARHKRTQKHMKLLEAINN